MFGLDGRAARRHRRDSRRKGVIGLTVAAMVAVFGLFAIPSANAVHDNGLFELDKNATNNELWTKLGTLAANINATQTTINICQTGTPPAIPPSFTILIDGEKLTVTANNSGSFGGNCPGSKRAYTVTRGTGGTAAAHSGAENVSLLTVAPFENSAGDDWNQVYDQIKLDANDEGDDDKCIALGATECAFLTDPKGITVFNQGSSDIADVDTWSYADFSAPDADEIVNAYAAKYVDANDDQILYFGADRFATNGSKDFGFWFFKTPVAAENFAFTGTHSLGDVLILGTFTGGGATTTIRVYEWVGTGGNASQTGTIDGPNGDFTDCIQDPPLTGPDNGCATVNNTTIPVPWQYIAKGEAQAGQIPSGGFLEGGVNLTAIGLEGCFSSFLAETRSSPSLTAQLKDFTVGSFEACGATVTTTPADDEGTALTDTDDPADGLANAQLGTGAAGVDVTDTATFDVTGVSEWDGNVDFFICGPIDDPATCETGGVAAGSVAVDETTVKATSDVVNLTEAGRYCWRGEFTSTTNGVPDSTDASLGECFEVDPVQPTLSTTAWSSGDATGSAQTTPVSFGDPLYDKAVLGGTAYQPGTDGGDTDYPSINATMDTKAAGTITFTLVGPDGLTTDCTTEATALAGSTGTNPEDVTVDGDADYFTSGFTPDEPGDFHWKASYDGDSPNTLSVTHNDECDETGEDVTVQQLQPTMDTAQEFVPNDSATINVAAGAGDLDGNVVFKLYVDDATCTDPPAYTSTAQAVSDTDDAGDVTLSDTVSSDNSTAYTVDGTTFDWVVEFTSNTSAHLDVTSGCGNETSSIAIDNGVTQPSTP